MDERRQGYAEVLSGLEVLKESHANTDKKVDAIMAKIDGYNGLREKVAGQEKWIDRINNNIVALAVGVLCSIAGTLFIIFK